MLIYIRFTRLFYFSLLILVYNNIKTSDSKIIQSYAKDNSSVNLRASSKSIYQFINEKNSAIREIFTTKDESITKQNLKIKSNNKNSNFRNTQEKGVCYATCTERMAINLRITPVKYNVESETFVKQCSISHKVFKQKGIEMFVAKVCFNNIIFFKIHPSVIASIEGGTKTTRSKSIRNKPKVFRVKVDCDGGCCKDCEDEEMHQVLAIPSDTEGITHINDCAVGDDVPEKRSWTDKAGVTVDKYIFNICRADKHILRRNEHISKFRTKRKPLSEDNLPEMAPQDCERNTCCKTCIVKDTYSTKEEDEPESNNNNTSGITHKINVLVTANGQGTDFVQNCATSSNEDPVTDESTNTSLFYIVICKEDLMVVKRNPNVVSIEKKEKPGCSDLGQLSQQCGSYWNQARLKCCPEHVCDKDTKKCVENINDDNDMGGTNETMNREENFYDDDSLGGTNGTMNNEENINDGNIEGTNESINKEENINDDNNMEGKNETINTRENFYNDNILGGTNETMNNEKNVEFGINMEETNEPIHNEENYYDENYMEKTD